jgi:hypothetical protein
MEADSVVEAIQVDAAQEAAQRVAGEVAIDSAVIASEVAQVGDELADHAEASEERHTEILDGQEWQRQQFNQLQANLTSLQSQLTALLSAQQSQLTALQNQLTTNQQNQQNNPPSPDSTSLSPVPEVVAVVEPSADAGGPERTQSNPSTSAPKRKRRLI